jgi:hypothetical protein
LDEKFYDGFFSQGSLLVGATNGRPYKQKSAEKTNSLPIFDIMG